jgi:hypothetical protein
MVTSEERLKILSMIQEGKITAEQGMELIAAMESKRPEKPGAPRVDQPPPAVSSGDRDSRWFRVRVTDTQTGKSRVNIRLPINLVQAGLKMGARFSPEVEGRLDQKQIVALIKSGEVGKIVDVFDEEDGEHVEVFIE